MDKIYIKNHEIITKEYANSNLSTTIQYTTMPVASVETVGQIIQYIGTNTQDYTNGYFYIGTTDGEAVPTYSWENVEVQASGSGIPVFDLEENEGIQSNKPFVLETHTKGIYVINSTSGYDKLYIKARSSDTTIVNIKILYGSWGKTAFYYNGEYTYEYSGTLLKTFEPGNIEVTGNSSNTFLSLSPGSISKSANSYTISSDSYSGTGNNNVNLSAVDLINQPRTISAKKTFTVLPESSVTPTTNNQLVNKSYVDTKLSSVYKYKGTVATYSQLPNSDLSIGDVYNIEQEDSTHGIKAGDNVAWTGSAWDVLAGTVDLSGKQDTIQYSAMPTADSTTVGKIIQYIGITDSTYTNGYWYKCILDDNIYSWVEISGGSGSVDIDNISITENTSGEIQTVGVIDQNTSNTDKIWTGTLAQYNSLVSKDSDTYYFITDDQSGNYRENVEVITSQDTSYTIVNLTANKSYKLGELTNLTISACETFDEETVIYFDSGSIATVLSMPNDVVLIGDEIEADKSYIIAILNKIAVIKGYEVE